MPTGDDAPLTCSQRASDGAIFRCSREVLSFTSHAPGAYAGERGPRMSAPRGHLRIEARRRRVLAIMTHRGRSRRVITECSSTRTRSHTCPLTDYRPLHCHADARKAQAASVHGAKSTTLAAHIGAQLAAAHMLTTPEAPSPSVLYLRRPFRAARRAIRPQELPHYR
jgi:hypothetical protein